MTFEEADLPVLDFVEPSDFERLEVLFAPPEAARFFEPELADFEADFDEPVPDDELDLDDSLFVDLPAAFDVPRPFPSDVSPDLEPGSFLFSDDLFALEVAFPDDAVFLDVVGILFCLPSRYGW